MKGGEQQSARGGLRGEGRCRMSSEQGAMGEGSLGWRGWLEKGEVRFVISSVLKQELAKAPVQVQQLLEKYRDDCFEYIELTAEAVELADKYIAEKVAGRSSLKDCRHIAIATIHKADVLASWNFKHIVNLDRIRGYNGVNLKNGYAVS
jgi:hypothetical protein